jgi:hypothetical protein
MSADRTPDSRSCSGNQCDRGKTRAGRRARSGRSGCPGVVEDGCMIGDRWRVDAPAAAVWPWVAQVRLGPYSYDWIDNLGRRSPQRLIGLPEPRVGEAFTTAGGRKLGRIVSVDPGSHLTATIMGAVMSYVLVPSRTTRPASCSRWSSEEPLGRPGAVRRRPGHGPTAIAEPETTRRMPSTAGPSCVAKSCARSSATYLLVARPIGGMSVDLDMVQGMFFRTDR